MSDPLQTDFPELSNLSREDLEELLADPLYFQSIFHSLPRVEALYQSQAELGSANEAIAQKNLTLQEGLYTLRSETKEAFDEAKRLEARWKELEREQKEMYQRFTPQFLLMRLKHSTSAQDDLSERLASSFVHSSSSSSSFSNENETAVAATNKEMDDFVREFKELRKVYHKRVVWGERWAGGQVQWRDD
ncbi:hypothetical protein JAAARDRAFT_30371 [Jaapia argillacea MUCL 33604]|uniref:VPS37 C-terminal domain-containing protein n=1 Tax=Jaapia argillacea MUCL 33604 TaxID=933084 RepID=A0A067Q8K9_9AGAM|nr:hypothetical protein JAAARDRAFT_30371 [Jaapia argillacea MUCL 33604]